MSNSVVQDVTCPFCGYRCDRAGEMHDKPVTPEDGDVSICITCGKFSIFEARRKKGLRKPNVAEQQEIALDWDCYRAHLAWKQAMAGRTLQ